jgi:methionyl-tRNA formyltransferase
MMDGERVKVYRASLALHAPAMDAGEWRMADGAWLVGCADGAVKLDEVQLPGKPPMKAEDFLRGWRGERSGRFTRA